MQHIVVCRLLCVCLQHEHLEQWQLALSTYDFAANCAAECLDPLAWIGSE